MFGSLYLLKNFNNYFNRKVIRKDTLQEYLDIVGDDGFYLLQECNFNPNDGINTTHIVGDSAHPFETEWNPDYVLYVEEGIIKSRWFVLEFTRKLVGQYDMSLKRDTIVDKYDIITTANTYIEKAHLEDTDPMIVNNEGIQFNQIKKSEHYLKDDTKIPWIVAYLNQHERPFTEIKAEYSSSEILEIENCPELLELFPNITRATTDQEVNHKIFDDNNFKYYFRYHFAENAFPIVHNRRFQVDCSVSPTTHSEKLGQGWDAVPVDSGYEIGTNICDITGPWGYVDNGWDKMGGGVISRPMKEIANDVGENFKNNFNTRVQAVYNAMGCTHHSTDYVEPIGLEKYIGRIIHVQATGRYFVFNITDLGGSSFSQDGNLLVNSLLTSFNSVSNKTRWTIYENPSRVGVNARCSSNKVYKMQLNAGVSIKLDLLGTKSEQGHELAYQTQYAPYDIICFPCFSTTITKTDGTKQNVIGNAGLNIARAISKQLGSANLYDIQILPYCPARELIGTDGDIDLRKAGTRQVLEIKTDDQAQTLVSYCIFATNPWHYFEISKIGTSIYNDDEENVADVLSIDNKKIQSNTDMHRLSSPNYASSFEFNLAKCIAPTGSYPSMSKFKVDICFRPQNPYIHIAPDFSFLYGGDYNDSRGLICSGDFGLTTMSNAWTDYTVRNKNYQNIFDRQISNMETNRAIGREKDNWNIAKASVNAAIQSAMGGWLGQQSKLLPIGKLASGIVGAGLGAISGGMGIAGAVKNKQWNEASFIESRDYSIDMFNMQMDNIKAMPDTITHSASFTNNFKFYPVLEFYTCTDIEKQALEQKIIYNGMTVGRIDRIENYLSSSEIRFVKGQVIRLDFLEEDSHVANDIYNEINKGLFFSPYTPVNPKGESYGKK